MSLITIHRRCTECEESRQLLRECSSDIEKIRLEYKELYELARRNLAKMAKQVDPCPEDAAGAPIDSRARIRDQVLALKASRRAR